MPEAKRRLGATSGVLFTATAEDAVRDCDALLLATEWLQFRSPDFTRLRTLLRQPVVFDGRNVYSPAAMAAAGLEYHAIGRTLLEAA
jgi:UDPglucose 6-dehydrogenase